MSDVTRILERIDAGDAAAAGDLLPLVYAELRALAAARMAGERHDHTLQATALVHEAYLRLVGPGEGGGTGGPPPRRWAGRPHFFHAAAEAMRRILIDHARARATHKRGGGAGGVPPRRVPLDVLDLAARQDSEEILALDEAFARLEVQNPEAAAVVRLRFYAGLSVAETADALGCSPRSVNRAWTFARAWLFRELDPG